MRILVTGASGFIGTPLSHRLAESGHEVVAMYFNGNHLPQIQHKNIFPIRCDISRISDVQKAIKHCDHCFHLAALAKPWASDPGQFQRVNVEGTRNVVMAALDSEIKRVVFTSTASVFGPANAANPVNETSPLAATLDSDYERSKLKCEDVVKEFQSHGLDIVTVYPSRVFGPGPLNPSNSLTRIFKQFADRRWRVIPGDGRAVGNYVFVDDVIEGLRLAMMKSKPNERYLIGGENLSFNQIVNHLRAATGANHHLIRMPKFALSVLAKSLVLSARIRGTPPPVTPAFVNKYLRDWHVDTSRARRELGYKPRSFVVGLKNTIAWLADS